MRFYSRLKSPSYVMFHAGHKIVEVSHGNNIAVPINIGMVRFRQIPNSDTGDRIHLKGGVVRGILDSDAAADELRKAGHQILDDDGKDITGQEVCLFLKQHKRYGTDFVSIDDGEVRDLLEDIWIQEVGSEVFCKLCERPFSTVTKARHHCRTSNDHAANLLARGEHVLPQSESARVAVA